jgi:hypothetical protein
VTFTPAEMLPIWVNAGVNVTDTRHLMLLALARAVGVWACFDAPRIGEPLRSHWYLTDATFQPVVLRYEQVSGEPTAPLPDTLAVRTGPTPVPTVEIRPG